MYSYTCCYIKDDIACLDIMLFSFRSTRTFHTHIQTPSALRNATQHNTTQVTTDFTKREIVAEQHPSHQVHFTTATFFFWTSKVNKISLYKTILNWIFESIGSLLFEFHFPFRSNLPLHHSLSSLCFSECIGVVCS